MAQQVERTHGRIATRFLTRSLGLAALTLVVGCAERSVPRLDAVVASPLAVQNVQASAMTDFSAAGGVPQSSDVGSSDGPTPLVALGGSAQPLIDFSARDSIPAGISRQSGEMALAQGGARMSDEQDFSAVSERESIASDKERLANQRAQYVVIAPQALPARVNAGGAVSLVGYALESTNAPGEPIYKRLNLLGAKQSQRACARFTSADLAQESFLARGGPTRDPGNLDPDGDGFACSWDPRPFRAALQ